MKHLLPPSRHPEPNHATVMRVSREGSPASKRRFFSRNIFGVSNKGGRSGFTLVELLVYIGITAIVLVVFTSFTVTVTQNSARSKIVQELQQNSRLSLDRLTQEVRDARQIDPSSFNPPLDPGTLVLNQSTGPDHVFAVNGSQALTLDGQPLTSPKVQVDSFLLANTSPSVTITLTLSDTLSSSPQSITVTTSLTPHQQLY